MQLSAAVKENTSRLSACKPGSTKQFQFTAHLYRLLTMQRCDTSKGDARDSYLCSLNLIKSHFSSHFLQKSAIQMDYTLIKKKDACTASLILGNRLYNFYSHSQSLNNTIEHTCSRFNNTFLNFRNVGLVCSHSLC